VSANGQSILRYFKETAGKPGATLCLSVGQPPIALLRPVATDPRFVNRADVEALTNWRNKYGGVFLTEFNATAEQTTHWLTKMVGPDDTRILFMIDDLTGRTFGYMGIAFIDWAKNYVEADAIVRGDSAPAGAMTACLKALLGWAKNGLGLENIRVRVRSDNPAVDFYRKLGFREEKRVSLRKTTQAEKIVWLEDNGPSSVQLVHMTLDPNSLP
jgi:RimJ/RimL family protein N-acetyltransferase